MYTKNIFVLILLCAYGINSINACWPKIHKNSDDIQQFSLNYDASMPPLPQEETDGIYKPTGNTSSSNNISAGTHARTTSYGGEGSQSFRDYAENMEEANKPLSQLRAEAGAGVTNYFDSLKLPPEEQRLKPSQSQMNLQYLKASERHYQQYNDKDKKPYASMAKRLGINLARTSLAELVQLAKVEQQKNQDNNN